MLTHKNLGVNEKPDDFYLEGGRLLEYPTLEGREKDVLEKKKVTEQKESGRHRAPKHSGYAEQLCSG